MLGPLPQYRNTNSNTNTYNINNDNKTIFKLVDLLQRNGLVAINVGPVYFKTPITYYVKNYNLKIILQL